MRELTREETLEVMCAPEITDEPEGPDFEETDGLEEEKFVNNWIEREMK
jgi:hypothetical protein